MDPKRNIKGLKLTLGEKKEKKRNNKKYENITQKYNCFHSQILLNDFGFWDFSSWPDMLTGVEKSEPFKKCTWWPVETIV